MAVADDQVGRALLRRGRWWANPAAGYVLVFYAAQEVREIFFTDGESAGASAA